MRLSILMFLALALISAQSARADLVYVSTVDGWGHPNAFESVDTTTGAVNVISRDTPSLTGMAFINGQLYGVGSNSGDLYRVDTTTGAATNLGTIAQYGAGSGGSDLVAGPGGTAYLINAALNNGTISTLSPPSTSTVLTTLPYFGGQFKFTAGPDGRIYSVSYDQFNPVPQQLEVLDPTTGHVTMGPILAPQGTIDWYSHLVFNGTTLNVVSPTGLYTINTTTGAVTQDFTFSSNIGGVMAAASRPSVVPEPSSFLLFGAAAVLLGIARGRTRRDR